jgi:colicin import membrane protein
VTTAALQRDALLPRRPGGMGAGLMLALLAHGLLVVALTFAVSWRSSEPEGVEAELWAAVPQIAAPPLAAPEPQPVEVKRPEPAPKPEPVPVPVPDAQIAIEKAKREEAKREELKREEAQREEIKREQQRAKEEAERKKKELAEKKKDEDRLEALRQANLKRMLGQAGAANDATSSTGTAAQTAGPSAGYAGRIKARIRPNIVLTDNVDGNPMATVEVRLAPDGTIVARKLVKSSGVKVWDDAVLRAIDKTEVLPRDTDGRVPPAFEIDFRPRD